MLKEMTVGAARHLNALRRRIMGDRPEGLERLRTHAGDHATFALLYEALEVGVLELRDGKWSFRYSTAFLAQDDVQPLTAFADKEKVYEAEELWPFFIARIPSVTQPQVLETIEREKIDAHDPVQLLRRFGTRTIANPFVLVVQP